MPLVPPPPPQIRNYGHDRKRVWPKPRYKWHKCPFCHNQFTGRQWLSHTRKERDRAIAVEWPPTRQGSRRSNPFEPLKPLIESASIFGRSDRRRLRSGSPGTSLCCSLAGLPRNKVVVIH